MIQGGNEMRRYKIISLLCAMILLLSSLVGCTDNKGTTVNSDKSFSMIAHWNSTGLINHFNTSTTCDVFTMFVVEGLYSYVRTTDEVYCQLAEELPVHTEEDLAKYKDDMGDDMYDYFVGEGYEKVSVTTAKIRENAKWQNGDPVTAKDIWAYYYIVHPTSTNYMITVSAVDDRTIQFVWNPMKEPVDKVKDLLLSLDISGTVHYETFLNYAERCHEITMSWPVNTNINLWGAFNRYPMGIGDAEIAKVRDEFYAFNPSWYVATGPFKIERFSATQILLTKNEYYWNKDAIGFDKVKLYSFSDTNQVYSLLANNTLDYWDGYIVPDTLDWVLKQNENLINIKMYDPGTYGLMFNLENKYLKDIRVRQAMQYIFDRDKIKDIANKYATTSYFATMGMAPTEAKMYMSEEGYNSLTKYDCNHEIATELLESAGWVKTNGVWTADGQPVKFTIGAPNALISTNAMQAAVSQLKEFGIDAEMIVSSNYLGEAQATGSKFDMTLDFNDLNMSFSYPTGSYQQFSNVYARNSHIERYPADYADQQKNGQVKLVFNGLYGDTNKYEFADHINTFYYLEGEELNYMVDVFNHGIADNCYGVQFFENITSSTFNTSRIGGIAFEDKWSANRNCEYVPTADTSDFMTMARYNLYYAKSYPIIEGVLQPK